MLLSLLPTTALAADTYPTASEVCVDGGKYFGEPGSYYFKNNETACSKNSTGYNAYYNPTTGTLTLDGYNGGSITVGGTKSKITVVLVGNNIIDNGSLTSAWGGDITIKSSSGGTLSITNTLNGGNAAIGIETGLSASNTTGNVTIKGNAKVTIDMTHNGTSTYEKAYGIYAKENITISENASMDITCATPNNTTGGDRCNGLYAAKDVTIDTNGKIKIDVTNAGKDDGYSFGVYPMGNATLSKVGEMEVEWKKHATHTSYPGGVVYKGASLSDTDYAINEDTTNCYASYRKGTPYTVTVENGDLAGPGVVSYAKNNGNFLAGDTVSIRPYERKSNSNEVIPFKEWTSPNVTLSSPTMASNSFKVLDKNVTVTAMHNPFNGTPEFKRTSNSSGTIEFQTAVKPDGGAEYFEYVEVGKENDSYGYRSIAPQPTTASTASSYKYSVSASNYSTGGDIKNLEAGNYRMAVTLNGERYLSDPFKVDYTATPVPTANISLNKTGTVDFGSEEEGYSDAPTAQTVTITNSGTADTGPLTIALNGVNASSFKLDKTNITNITASDKDTFTVQPKTGLAAGTYTATVKVGGTGVTEKSFDVKFTVTAPLTAIAVPTANSVTYNGTEKTGVNDGMGYTLGGTYKATNVGAADYTATATLNAGYKWTDGSIDVKTITWNIGKGTLTVDSFNFVPPTDPEYDGSNKTASITLKSPLTGAGTITPTYTKGSSVVTDTKDAGEYTVKFNVAAGDNFNEASDLTSAEWKFTVTPATWGTPTETLSAVNPTNAGGNDGQITGTTNTMQYKKSTDSDWTDCSGDVTGLAAGTYYVRYKADGNHTASDTNYKTVTLTDPGATRYSVTVTDGTADPTGNQAAGTEVTITANTKTGFNFKEWTGLDAGVYKIGSTKTSNPATFIMPAANVNVTATYDPAALTGTASITGNLKYDEELTATLTGDNNTGNLTYKWYHSGEAGEIATNKTGKYTLVKDDIGKTITVKITSDVQTGEITGSTTGTIDKADGLAAPSAFTLSFTPNSDGKTFTATIPTVTGGEYSFDGANYSETNTKDNCTANTSYTGYVRFKETPTHKTGTETRSTQTSPKLTVATPTFTPNGVSSFSGTQSVTIKCDTADAKIYYTTDGKVPTSADKLYTTALTLTSTTTLKAIAVKTGMNDSEIATATFTKASGGSGGSGGGGYVLE